MLVRRLFVLSIGVPALVGACSPREDINQPSPARLTAAAPDSFHVDFETSQGRFRIAAYRAWAPVGVDRFYYLTSHNFYRGARFYRVVDGFVAQFGYTGQPSLDSVWRALQIDDEPVGHTNERGTISYARAGARTRSFQFFLNLADNGRLDSVASGGVVGYPPVGKVIEGMEVVDALNAEYGQTARQDSIFMAGNEYLRRTFPRMDSIIGTEVVQEWRSN